MSTGVAEPSTSTGIGIGVASGSGSGVVGVTTTIANVPVGGESGEPGGKKKKMTKRRKVNHACLYCRRSHMTCDEGRPCQRCIKREIGHLCHDEQRPPKQDRHSSQPAQANIATTSSTSRSLTPVTTTTVNPAVTTGASTTVSGSVSGTASTTLPYLIQPQPQPQPPPQPQPQSQPSPQTQTQTQPQFYYGGYGGEAFGSEFSVLSDFLETLDDSTFFSAPTTTTAVSPSLMFSAYAPPPLTTTTSGLTSTSTSTTIPNATNRTNGTSVLLGTGGIRRTTSTSTEPETETDTQTQTHTPNAEDSSTPASNPSDSNSNRENEYDNDNEDQITIKTEETPLPLPEPTKTEKFLLTAADQDSGLSRDERLSRVISSKYEAGLLKPYNYVKGYARLSRWMDVNVSQESKRQILQPLSVLRPKFRAVAQSLRDIDLVFIEEAFERLLLDYDRVFSAMGVPACLWRRTGEIYKGNREFSQLVGVDGFLMREGRLCIYELMAEESAVNYWEKYGNVAFDSSQKAVLTSCVLRYKPHLSVGGGGGSASTTTAAGPGPGGSVVGAGLGSRHGYPAPMMPPSNSNSNAASTTTGAVVAGSAAAAAGTGDGDDQIREAGLINCCFSFTIRRDKWGIPSMIVGNFIRC